MEAYSSVSTWQAKMGPSELYRSPGGLQCSRKRTQGRCCLAGEAALKENYEPACGKQDRQSERDPGDHCYRTAGHLLRPKAMYRDV